MHVLTVVAPAPNPKRTLARVSLLDTLEGIGENNSELQELGDCRALASEGWGEMVPNDKKRDKNDDDFGATVEDWLVEASSTAEEALVSSVLRR